MELPNDLAAWTYETVVGIVEEYELEPAYFDYKEALNASDPTYRNNLNSSVRRTACGLANTDGGLILFGIKDRRQKVAAPVDRIVGIPLVGDLGKEFADKVNRIQPSLQFETAPALIPLAADPTKGIFVVRIAASSRRPHMVQHDGVFYRRDAGGNSVTMDFYQVRDLMLMQRQTLLANLKWELEENVIALCTRLDGLPLPVYDWLATARKEVKLTVETTRDTIRLTQQQAVKATTFWIASPDGGRLRVAALQEAIHSGQFLVLREDVGRLVGGEAYNAMQSLLNAIDSYQRVYRIVGDHMEWLAALTRTVRDKRPYVDVDGNAFAFLYTLHDRQQDILRLSVALLNHLLNPGTELRMPQLNPLSPLEGQTEKIKAHLATHEEVEEWVSNGYLSGMLTGDYATTPEEIAATIERYPKLDELIGRPLRARIEPYASEIIRRLEADGMDETMRWLQTVLGQEAE